MKHIKKKLLNKKIHYVVTYVTFKKKIIYHL